MQQRSQFRRNVDRDVRWTSDIRRQPVVIAVDLAETNNQETYEFLSSIERAEDTTSLCYSSTDV